MTPDPIKAKIHNRDEIIEILNKFRFSEVGNTALANMITSEVKKEKEATTQTITKNSRTSLRGRLCKASKEYERIRNKRKFFTGHILSESKDGKSWRIRRDGFDTAITLHKKFVILV